MDPWPRADTVGISGFNAGRAASQRQPTLPRADSIAYAGTKTRESWPDVFPVKYPFANSLFYVAGAARLPTQANRPGTAAAGVHSF
jgi:hypothetical protein